MRTLFDGVFQVPPGHYLIATDKHIQLHQYWDFNYPKANGHAPQRSDADYAAEFRHAWRRRFASGCVPTCRLAAISAVGWTRARCSASRRSIILDRFVLSP